ncbi:unannotated protein [freshwater metagenome]|uniref:Unannotated protein n=1 Tax=freshwater metagenome TaxID=449393 RepID=A0A6J6E3K9_9ZZZZ
MNATANNCVEVGGECGNQSLTFTRAHLGDVSEVKGGSTHELNVEVTQADGAAGSFSNRRERFGEHVVERLTVGEALTELGRFTAKLFV